MGLRWRKYGPLVCAAMTAEEPGDVYFDDGQLQAMSERGIIVADPDHDKNALWHWVAHCIPVWATGVDLASKRECERLRTENALLRRQNKTVPLEGS